MTKCDIKNKTTYMMGDEGRSVLGGGVRRRGGRGGWSSALKTLEHNLHSVHKPTSEINSSVISFISLVRNLYPGVPYESGL